MAELRLYQPAFTAGVLSPALWARTDLAKFQTGLKRAENVFIHAHGGASNRPGLNFCGEVKASNRKARLIPFQFNADEAFILEFGHLTMRVYRYGAPIMSGGSPYEIATPWTEDMVGSLVFAQEADVMYIVCGDTPIRKLSRFADTNWTLTSVDFKAKINPPTGYNVTSSSGSPNIYQYVIAYQYDDGGTLKWSGDSNVVSVRYEISDSGKQNALQWKDVPGALQYRIGRRSGTSGVFTTIYTGPLATVNDDNSLTGPTFTYAVGTGLNGNIAMLRAIPNAANVQSYVISSISDETGEESLPSQSFTVTHDLSVAGRYNLITWGVVPGASRYLVYKNESGTYGYIGGVDGLQFRDDNITPDLSDAPQIGRNPFVGVGNYPTVVAFIEQRLVFAATQNDPQAVWMSQSASYENFGYSSPAKASDAVTFRVKSRQINEIRSIVPMKGMLLMSSAAEWLVTGGSNSDAISPSALKIDNQGYRGSNRVQPVNVGEVMLFAQVRGGVVRDLNYEFANDGYTGKDLTVMARHLFEHKEIKAWAYAQSPSSIVWVVMNDGRLLSMTYMREHEVWAWTEHSSAGGVFEDVAVISEGTEDVPYFIVRRTIGGSQKRYIERLHTRVMADVADAFFVDSGLSYDGAPATMFSGLAHLNGEEVVALADGNVIRGLTVSGGSVTLSSPASKVHIGLSYEALIESLNLDLGPVQGMGTVQGRKKSVAALTLRLERSRGVFVGPRDGDRDSTALVEWKQRSTEPWGAPIELYTGDVKMTLPWTWNEEGSVVVKQFDPLPVTVLALMPDVVVGQ